MKELKNDVIEKEYQKFQTTIYIGLGIIFLAVVILSYSIFREDKSFQSLHDLIINNPVEDKQGYVETLKEPLRFAYYENELNNYFYFIQDPEGYLYVIRMSDQDYQNLKNQTVNETKVRIEGVTKIIPEDIRQIAIEVYNEDFYPDDPITLEESNDYFGSIYLDLNLASMTDIMIVILAIFIIIGVIVLGIGLNKKYKYRKNMKKLTAEEKIKLATELNDPDSFYYKSAHIYLTKHYIFNLAKTFEVIPYQEVSWIYPFDIKSRGIKVGANIQVFTKDGKKRTVAYLPTYTKKNQEVFNEIYETLSLKNTKMLKGYTKENQQKFKDKLRNDVKK